MSFEKELYFLQQNENEDILSNKKIIASEIEIANLKSIFPNIPEEFLEYLLEIGSGNIMGSQFKIMSDLFNFCDLGFDDVYFVPENIKFFGDNYCGDFAGFDFSNDKNEVVEFWHDSNEMYYTGKTFREYIREKMLMP